MRKLKINRIRFHILLFLLLSCLLCSCGNVSKDQLVTCKNGMITIQIPSNSGIDKDELDDGIENGTYTSYKITKYESILLTMTEEQYNFYKNTLDAAMFLALQYFTETEDTFDSFDYNDTFTEITYYMTGDYDDWDITIANLSLMEYLENYQVRLGYYDVIHMVYYNVETGELIRESEWDFWDDHEDYF